MRTSYVFTALCALALSPGTILAEEVKLPAPVLEWSFYVLLIFALVVAVGIFYRQGKGRKDESLNILLDDQRDAIHSVGPEVSVSDCVRQMNEQVIGAMLVIEDDELIGIFTERDALTKVLGRGLDASSTSVAAVMSGNPTCVTPSTTLDEAMAIISTQRIRHLPVVADGKVQGMVSSGDLTQWLVEDRSGEIREIVDIAGQR